MTDLSVTGTARRRIRSFSVWVWVCGSVVLGISALNTITGDVQDEREIVGDGVKPWDVEDPTIFEPDGATYSGEGRGLIRIPLEDHDQDPYMVVSPDAGDYIGLSVTRAEYLGRTADESFFPYFMGGVRTPDDELLILPPDADLELWVDTDAPWEFTLQKTPVTEITGGFASGVGSDILVYRGDATSARFVQKGTGWFFVTFDNIAGRAGGAIIDSGDVDERQSWPAGTPIYFSIESDDAQDSWFIDIDELATDAPTPDSPKGTP